MISWLTGNWFNVFQTVALLATLAVTRSALGTSERASRASNELMMTSSNREIWGQLVSNPQLESALRGTPTKYEDIRLDEKRFVLQVIQHTAACYEIIRMGGVATVAGFRRDIHVTLTSPVFLAVWDRYKIYYRPAFVGFVDECIAGINLEKPLTAAPSGLRRAAGRLVNLPKRS